MGYLIAIAVGLALVVGAIAGLFAILEAIAKGTVATKNEFILWLGRKRLGVQAFIPDELVEKVKEQPRRNARSGWPAEPPEYPRPLPSKDTDAANLRAYEPKAAIFSPLESAVFRGAVEQVFTSQLVESTRTIDIDRVAELIGMEPTPTYAHLFASLGEKPSYPFSSPKRPRTIPSPPSWTPWRPVIAVPSLSPPYYGPRLSILNRFVDVAHRDEFSKMMAACTLREHLIPPSPLCEILSLTIPAAVPPALT